MLNSPEVTVSSVEKEGMSPKNTFTKEEDEKLLKLVEKYKGKNWKIISSYFENKNDIQCFSRFKRIKPGIKRGFWTKEEDEKVLTLYEKYGKKWAKIAKDVTTRTGKQVRDRFINVLDPSLNRKPFTPEEDAKISELYKKYGSKWAKIAKECKTRRSPDLIKNRFYSKLKEKPPKKKSISKKEKEKIASNIGHKRKRSKEKNAEKDSDSEAFDLFGSFHSDDYDGSISQEINLPELSDILPQKKDGNV